MRRRARHRSPCPGDRSQFRRAGTELASPQPEPIPGTRKMPRVVLVLCTVGLLSTLGGCVLAPTYQLASIAATGLSYALTGKSISDHALSTVTEQDCAMLRVMSGDEVCTNPDHGRLPEIMIVGAAADRAASDDARPASPGSTTLPGPPEIAGHRALDSLLISTTRAQHRSTALGRIPADLCRHWQLSKSRQCRASESRAHRGFDCGSDDRRATALPGCARSIRR